MDKSVPRNAPASAALNDGSIDSSITPGTYRLVDVDITRHQKSKSTSDVILVPAPSNDPDDPLNWSRPRKLLALSCAVAYTFANGVANSVLYSVLVPLSDATGLSVGDLNSGTGYLFLLAGWALLFWQPMAQIFGKRPVYIVSMLGCMTMTVVAPYMAKASGVWIGRTILAGFFAAPIEALPELTIADVFFAHERGTYLGVYAFFFAGGNFFAPIISGWIDLGIGYRWVFNIPSIFCGCVALFLILFQEETTYHRRNIQVARADDGSFPEKSGALPGHADDAPALSCPRKTYLQKISFSIYAHPKQALYRVWLSIRLLTWPLVLYTGISYGGYLIWFNVLNATSSLILSSPPYSFSSGIVGTTYIACILGVIGGSIFNGYISDRIAISLARRNKAAPGVFEPEFRLWGFALTTLVTSAALILWGVGAQHDVHWVGLLAAMMGLAFTNAAGVLSVTYLVDSYAEISSDALTTLVLIRNTMGFAVNYGVTPWIEKLGYQNCFISAAFVALAVNSLFLLMIWKGKWIREKYRVQYWQVVKRNTEKGMIH